MRNKDTGLKNTAALHEAEKDRMASDKSTGKIANNVFPAGADVHVLGFTCAKKDGAALVELAKADPVFDVEWLLTHGNDGG